MLDLVILISLGIGVLVGIKRGFILQIIYLLGFIIAFIVAKMYCNEFAETLVLWIPYPTLGAEAPFEMLLQNQNLENAYYRGIAFVMIFLGVKIVLQLIGAMLDFVSRLPLLKQFNKVAGGILGFIEVYLFAFIILYIAALIPIETIQTALHNSILGEAMIKHTPIISQDIMDLWIRD